MIDISKIISTIHLLWRAFCNYRLKVFYMAILGFIGGLLGGIGISAIIPLFSLATNNASATPDWISRFIEGFFSLLHLNYNLVTLLIIIGVLFIIKAVFLYFANYINARITSGYEQDTRTDLLKKTMAADWPYLLERKVGHLETTLITDVTRAAGILNQLSSIILTTTSLLAYSIVALTISVYITLITLTLGAVIFFLLKPLLYRIRRQSETWVKNSKIVANQVAEYTFGTKSIKAAGVESKVLTKIHKNFIELRQSNLKLGVYSYFQVALQEPISLLLVVGIFVFSYSRPEFQLASFIAVIYLVQKMSSFMQSIQGRLNGINESLPFLRNVVEYTEQADIHRENVGNEADKFIFERSLEFKNVEFMYFGTKQVLSDINFVVEKGKMTGLIGPSGSGKTTVVDLLLKLFKPTSGNILLDNKNISDISTRDWRESIGYVSQDIFLLSDTIENNIKFFDSNLSNEDMVHAAKMANIYDVISELPSKFLTVVGERGVKLSVGQRQRIVLARVLARKPKILVLDEATSALDNESEALIQKTLENLKEKMTILIIAHRLSTVLNCDKLIALENGKIAEQGTPDGLLKNKDSYFYRTYTIGLN